MTDNPVTRRSPAGVILLILTLCLGTLGYELSPIFARTAHATTSSYDCSQPMNCVTFYTKTRDWNNGGGREMLNGSAGQGTWWNMSPTGSANPKFQNPGPGASFWLRPSNPDDGTFQIVSDYNTGLCADSQWSALTRIDMILSEPCSATAQSQKFYLEPYGDAYMIRQVQNSDQSVQSDQCLFWHEPMVNGTFYAAAYPCNNGGDWAEGWGLWYIYDPADPVSHRYVSLAAEYALAHCDRNSNSYCKFGNTTTSYYVQQTPLCKANIQNTGDTTTTVTLSASETTGTSTLTGQTWQVGTEVGWDVSVGAEGAAKWEFSNSYSANFSQSLDKTSSSSTAVTQTVSVLVNPHEYGYLTVNQVREKTTGSFTFDYGSFGQWDYSTDTTIDAAAPDSAGGFTATYTSGSSPLPCGGTIQTQLTTLPTPPANGPIEGFGTLGKCVSVAQTSYGNPIYIQSKNSSNPYDGCGYSASPSSTGGVQLSPFTTGSGVCMDAYGGGTGNGTQMVMWGCSGGGNQQWVLLPNDALYNPVSDRCLDDPGQNPADYTSLQLWDCNGSAAQVWHVPF